MEEEEAAVYTTTFEPLVGDLTSPRLFVEGVFHDANTTLWRWSNKWGIEWRTLGYFA